MSVVVVVSWCGSKEFEVFREIDGCHRYPRSWLADRLAHLHDGVPGEVEWSSVLMSHEKSAGDPEVDDGEFGKLEIDKSEELQQKVLDRLGQIKFDHTGEQFAVQHEVRICGNLVRAPVMCLDIGMDSKIEDLISPMQLQELCKTPAQRRSEKAKEVMVVMVVVVMVLVGWRWLIGGVVVVLVGLVCDGGGAGGGGDGGGGGGHG